MFRSIVLLSYVSGCYSVRIFTTWLTLKNYSFWWAWIAQSVHRLATGCTVQGSSPSRGRDFPHPSKWCPPNLLFKEYRMFPGVKWPGRCVNHPPHLAPRLKKEQGFTSAPHLGLRGLYLIFELSVRKNSSSSFLHSTIYLCCVADTLIFYCGFLSSILACTVCYS